MVRRSVGYDRYSSKAAFDTLNRLYTLLRRYTNFFQPVLKLKRKTRHGARVQKFYDQARTPYQRLLEFGVLSDSETTKLNASFAATNPVQLRSEIEDTLALLWGLADLGHAPVEPQEPRLVTG